MKTILRTVAVGACIGILAGRVYGQGLIAFDNLGNTNSAMTAFSSGLVFVIGSGGYALMSQDINLMLLGGPSLQSLQPIHTWLLNDNSATGIAVGTGHFADPTRGAYVVPGVQPGSTAVLQLRGWLGNFNSYEAASPFGLAGMTAAFENPTGTAGNVPDLVGMPALIVGVPEPSGFALAGAGLAVLLAWDRRKKCQAALVAACLAGCRLALRLAVHERRKI